MKDWIKKGNTVYVVSKDWGVSTGEATIEKVGKKYFYLKGLDRIKVKIDTLYGLDPYYKAVCKVYSSKTDFDRMEELKRKRYVIEKKLHLLTDEEIMEVYSVIIQRDRRL